MTIQELVREATYLEVALSADECLKCNVCNTVCPVARVTDLFPGPKYSGPQAQRFRLATTLPPASDIAPHDRVARSQRRLLLRLRDVHDRMPRGREDRRDEQSGAGGDEGGAPPEAARLAARPDRSRRAARGDLLADRQLGPPQPAEPADDRARDRDPPERTAAGILVADAALAAVALARRDARPRDDDAAARAAEPPPDRAVVLFHGCAANYYEPHVAMAAIDVLRRNGYETIVPEQVCCGLPLMNNGLYGQARRRAASNIDVLADYARRGYRIVGTSTSCTHTLKAEYREMLDVDDDDATVVAQATWDICEFLVDLHEQGRLDAHFGRLDERLPYHAPCQLKGHGIGIPAMDLFGMIPGLQAIDMDHDCCGVAGTYGLKKEKYDIAMAVGDPLFERVRATDSARAACDSETCRWQIERATDRPVKHPIEIIAAAYAAYTAEDAAAAAAAPESRRSEPVATGR